MCEMIQGATGKAPFVHKCTCKENWSPDPEKPFPNCDIAVIVKKGKTKLAIFLPLIPISLIFLCCCVMCSCKVFQGQSFCFSYTNVGVSLSTVENTRDPQKWYTYKFFAQTEKQERLTKT